MTGLRPRRNIVDEDLAIWPQRRSSTTSVVPRGIIHIQYTRRPSGLRTSRAAERRWIRIPAARWRARIVEKSPTKCSLQTRGVRSRKEKGGGEILEKLVSNQFIVLIKRAPLPLLI